VNPEDRAAWVERIQDANRALFEARAEVVAAEGAYTSMRHRPSQRGTKKVAVMKRRETAARNVIIAEKALEDLLELARSSGVPPGWIRDGLQTPASLGEGIVILDEDSAREAQGEVSD
jgi:hypothetical protein